MLEQLFIPSPVASPFDIPLNPLTRQGNKVINWSKMSDPRLFGLADYRLSERVKRGLLHGSGCGVEMLWVVYHFLNYSRTAFGERSGLVEGDHVDSAKLLQMDAAFDQHAAARTAGHPANECNR
ncbi:hypothetical protein D3C73_468310 [compost metagenome]